MHHQMLSAVPQWDYDGRHGSITRVFKFVDFAEAFSFMTRIAMAAERFRHHPDWSNSFNSVAITLTTHDESCLTQRDIDFARYADAAFAKFSQITTG
jgi:4a-hydroxytetrahydrobiopterin dehydratase